ncbi:MAG TPA: beta-ketoacyl-[acyl-carrier-protein] synthase family protein, partial [Phycisphaerales bacterium]|nr:beta-ketoacyl-[acyl-carrier-protein] synthase family protein [Phycisphaerales bacterium]
MKTNRTSKRVVITGMGWVTPLGDDLPGVWKRLLASESAIGPVTHFPASTYATNFAAEVRGFDFSRFIADRASHENAHLNTRYALAAASSAWKQAGLGDASTGSALNKGINPRRAGVYLGAGEGIPDFENFAAANLAGWNAESRATDGTKWSTAAYKHFNPARELEQEPNFAVAHLADAFGCRGPAFNCMTACAASTQAVGEASELIRRGDVDLMIAGGSHSMIHPLGFTGFIRLTAMSRRRDDPSTAARPFNITRDGFVMGEGAGMIVLESLDHALARGAKPLAEIGGYGSSADAYRITDIHPEGKGAQAAMLGALTQAGI